jgi:hypothetical protein
MTRVSLLAGCFGVCLALRTASADQTITFDTLPDGTSLSDGTSVSNQYVSQGVLFTGTATGSGETISSGAVVPQSGPNVLIDGPIGLEFSGGPLTFQFTTPQKTVSLYGGYFLLAGNPTSVNGTLTAYDQAGNPLPISAGPLTVYGGKTSTFFQLTSTQANIWSVTLDLGPFIYAAIDNLTFGGGATITPPPSPPAVTITTPAIGTYDFTKSALAISGTVAGQELLPTVQVTLTGISVPSGQPPAVYTTTIPLNGSQFSTSNAFPNLPVGNYILAVTATNLVGQAGSSSVVFTNLPPALSSLTPIQYAVGADKCQVVVFGNGIAAYFPADGTQIAIPTRVFNKWSQVHDNFILRSDGTLGCPTQAAVTLNSPVLSGVTYTIQNFERGRIYTTVGGPADGQAFYSPSIFVDAITALSTYSDPGAPPAITNLNDTFLYGMFEVGFPTADPVFDLSTDDPTYLFQRFLRPGYGGPANTLELRGLQPSLYVERVGGSALDFQQAMHRMPVAGDITPTIWETYPCQYQPQLGQFQCTVTHPHIEAVSPVHQVPMYSAASALPNPDDYCANINTGFDWSNTVALFAGLTSETLTEWSAIPLKNPPNTLAPSASDTTDILTMGWVRSSAPSSTDFPQTHHDMHDNDTGDFLSGLGSVVGTIAGCLSVVGCELGAYVGTEVGEQAGAAFGEWCDWDLHIRPLALPLADPNASFIFTAMSNPPVPPFWNLLASNGNPAVDGMPGAPEMGDMEIEWEANWQNKWLVQAGNHFVDAGSLVVLNGRWIIDCGHPPVHSEIHPPNTIIDIEASPPPQFMLTTDAAVTSAQVWFNQLYEGHPFQTQIWPPPRPSPTAQLSAYYYAIHGTGGSTHRNADGTTTFVFTPNFRVSPNPPLGTLSATVALGQNQVVVTASGTGQVPSHEVKGTGQVMMPSDDSSFGSGPVGDLMARWYVGWNDPPPLPN